MMPSPDLDAGLLPTPCIGVCQIDTQSKLKLCSGCWRLIEEIAQWATASESDKRTIWRAIQQRRQDAGIC